MQEHAVLENYAAGKRQHTKVRAFHHAKAKEKRRQAAAVQRLASHSCDSPASLKDSALSPLRDPPRIVQSKLLRIAFFFSGESEGSPSIRRLAAD